ncbi:hypothetical protein QYE76_036216 [Lolium multiflorum]|uniref:Ribonuclease H1 N-terminal domain-containing protein n=1 Tax=Lolium multiflorum TaxID=4521 RepID=A0AAD8VPY7_LOLMU|nr:hypothetical protein QYE76_036216 [Lolium multiflorum]
MDKFIRDQQQLTLPEHLRDWANKLSRVPDDGIKQDFFRIQVEFCEIIHQDFVRSAGEFYAGYQPSNSDIDTMLQMQDMMWYVVYKGKVPGVYNDWEECRRQWRTALTPVAHCPVIPSDSSSGAPGTSAMAHVMETAMAHVHTLQWRSTSLKQWSTTKPSSGAPCLDSSGALQLTNSGTPLWSNSGALLDMSWAHAVRHCYQG